MSDKDPYIAYVTFIDDSSTTYEYKWRRIADNWTLFTSAADEEWLVINRNVYGIRQRANPNYVEPTNV